MNEPQDTVGLYDSDYAEWSDRQVALLRDGRFTDLDLPNLIEEIEGLKKIDVREIKSRLVVLMMHLLKLEYQREKASGSWRSTVVEQRDRLGFILDDSPSLRRVLLEEIPRRYARARERAADETGIPLSTFPAACPFTVTDLLEDPP